MLNYQPLNALEVHKIALVSSLTKIYRLRMIDISKNCKLNKPRNILNPQMGAAILFVERRPPIKSRSI